MYGNDYATKINTSVYILKDNIGLKSEYGDISLTKQVGIIFTRQMRYLIFAFFLLVTIVINMDNGCITAAIPALRNNEDFLKSNNFLAVGLIGSISFMGNIIGIIISYIIVRNTNLYISIKSSE
jgi:hypothetical protein